MKNIKSIIIKSILPLICVAFVSCNQGEIFEKELYKKVFCILGNENSVFPIEYTFEEGGATANLSIYCGGTNPIEEDVEIEIEYCDSLFDEYNRRFFDIDTASFAIKLDPAKYEVSSFKVTMKANQADSYVKIPIKIQTIGLSPDSTYMIPFRIKSVSGGYEINKDRNAALFQPTLNNYYAKQKTKTSYSSKGIKSNLKLDGITVGSLEPFTASKRMYPISKNQVRVLAASFTPGKLEGDALKSFIEKNSIVLTIAEDKSVTVTPYKDFEMGAYESLEPNRYAEELDGNKYFYITYKCKIDKKWCIIEERLKREQETE